MRQLVIVLLYVMRFQWVVRFLLLPAFEQVDYTWDWREKGWNWTWRSWGTPGCSVDERQRRKRAEGLMTWKRQCILFFGIIAILMSIYSVVWYYNEMLRYEPVKRSSINKKCTISNHIITPMSNITSISLSYWKEMEGFENCFRRLRRKYLLLILLLIKYVSWS